jgi:hypothetical protein
LKIDLTSLSFNSKLLNGIGTASWGTALGQKRPDYPITVEGAQEILNSMRNDSIKIEFNPSNPLHKSNITNLNKKTIIAAGKYENVFINDVRINSPFILLVVEETYGVHIGRKSLKYNNKIKWNDCNNEKFYSKAQELFGNEACWFVHDISIRNNNELHFSAIKVSDEVLWYIDSKERQASWRILI